MYTTDPNNAKKQVPKARPQSAYGKGTQPGPQVLSARPNYVLINNKLLYQLATRTTLPFPPLLPS